MLVNNSEGFAPYVRKETEYLDSKKIGRLVRAVNHRPELARLVYRVVERILDDAVDGDVLVNTDTLRRLALLTKDPEVRWRLLQSRLVIRCPECESEVEFHCGINVCHVCETKLAVPIKALKLICENKCKSYKDKCAGLLTELERRRKAIIVRAKGRFQRR